MSDLTYAGIQAVRERRRDVRHHADDGVRPISDVGAIAVRHVRRVPDGEREVIDDGSELTVVGGCLVLTPAQQRIVFKRHKIMSPTSFSTDHMTDEQRRRFLYAIDKAISRKPGQSLVYFAPKTEEHSGLGCGKSTIARMGVYFNGGEVRYQWVDGMGVEAVSIRPYGSVLSCEAALRAAMANEVADVIRSREVVMVDDVGRSLTIKHVSWDEQGEERQRLWHSFVDTCCNAKVAIIFTTNMSYEGFQNEIGESCVSRLRMMNTVAIDMTGIPDYRDFQQDGVGDNGEGFGIPF